MRRSIPLWLIFAALLLGWGIGWVARSANFDLEEAEHEGAEQARSSANSRTVGRSLDIGPRLGLGDGDTASLFRQLLILFAISESGGSSSRDSFAAMHEMHQLVEQIPLEGIEAFLSELERRPDLDFRDTRLASGLVETLLTRLWKADEERAVSWAREHDCLSVIAGIVSERDPVAAIAFLRTHQSEIENPSRAKANIKRFAAESGPEELLALEDVLGKRGISEALVHVPEHLCEVYSNRWYERLKTGEAEMTALQGLLQRWGKFAPREMVAWYRSRAELGREAEFVHGLMSSLVRHHEKEGLNFAKHEFRRDPDMGRLMFTFTVNSIAEPRLWPLLAKQFPPNAKPTLSEFSKHFGIGRAPGPEGIVKAAESLGSSAERYRYLMRVLRDSRNWASEERGWEPAINASVREQLTNLSLETAQQRDVLQEFDEIAEAPSKREPENNLAPSLFAVP